MATMLRSAAMTLLSKTLLTFLYKYLSDVDVEGVEMPSLYGSTDGQGSGWGVRLSNVKLREGAELMEMPCTKSNKDKPPKPKSTKQKDEGSVATMQSHFKIKENVGIDNERGGETIFSPSDPPKSRLSQSNDDIAQLKSHDKRKKTNGSRTKGTSVSSANTYTTENAGSSMQTDRDHSDIDSLPSLPEVSSVEGSESPRPDTPVQDSKISFLSCFAPGTEPDQKKLMKMNGRHHEQQETNLSAETRPQVDGEHEDFQFDGYAKNAPSTDPDKTAISETDLRDAFDRVADEMELKDNEEGLDQNHGDDVEEEEDIISPKKMLRIGEGGYIGTLDVRLVQRELHVLVEDAFLTVEVFTKRESHGPKPSPDGEKEDPAAEGPETDSSGKKPSAEKPPVDPKELKTTGERVLAMNTIARILSIIPRLFLRDIQIRLVVLDENCDDDSPDGDKSSKMGTMSKGDEDSNVEDAEVIVDIGIGLLSVTEGEDFLSPFDNDDSSSHQEDETSGQPTQQTFRISSEQSKASLDNEYLERRIRTGKGGDGGIWLNVVNPRSDNSSRIFSNQNQEQSESAIPKPLWARQTWLESTHYNVLRCSGLDAQARIFLGTKKELAQASSSYLWSDPETYQGIDHTLYGFDHVVPGPTPHTLPPLAPPQSSRSLDEEDELGYLRSQVYKVDRNGIQSSKIESCFHRVARGLTPTRCTLEHLPCENCIKCWEASGNRTDEPVSLTNYLDAFTPMPGLALSISVRDPLELNVDRLSLEGLGTLISLFKKETVDDDETNHQESDLDPSNEEEDGEADEEQPPLMEVVAETEPSGGYFDYFFGRSKSDDGRRFSLLSPKKKKTLPPAFPSYFKPEHIQILGVHLAALRLRVHVMKEGDERRHNSGHSFSYWDARAECLTFDQQKLQSDEMSFQDLRLDLGILEIKEFKGTEQKILVSAGIPVPVQEDGSSFSFARHTTNRPPWPTTACALLDVPAPLETLVYESRDRHGLQLRLLQTCENPGTSAEKTRSLVNCQVGVHDIDLPWPVGPVFTDIKTEAVHSLLGKKKEGDKTDETSAKMHDTAKQFRIQVGGGKIKLDPLIDIRLPLTRFAGDICPDSGFSLETLIERAEVSYGRSSKKLVATANSAKGVSFKKLATLPEQVRLRILLFVEDLQPLEHALGVKRQSNSYLRCNAVNKGLGNLSVKKHRKKHHHHVAKTKCHRRQELLNRLLTLDDHSLESLWATHQKKQRKAKKTQKG